MVNLVNIIPAKHEHVSMLAENYQLTLQLLDISAQCFWFYKQFRNRLNATCPPPNGQQTKLATSW